MSPSAIRITIDLRRFDQRFMKQAPTSEPVFFSHVAQAARLCGHFALLALKATQASRLCYVLELSFNKSGTKRPPTVS